MLLLTKYEAIAVPTSQAPIVHARGQETGPRLKKVGLYAQSETQREAPNLLG